MFRGISSNGRAPLSMREVPGSITGFSKGNKNVFAAHGNILFFLSFLFFSFCWLSAHKTQVVTALQSLCAFLALASKKVLGRLLSVSGSLGGPRQLPGELKVVSSAFTQTITNISSLLHIYRPNRSDSRHYFPQIFNSC